MNPACFCTKYQRWVRNSWRTLQAFYLPEKYHFDPDEEEDYEE